MKRLFVLILIGFWAAGCKSQAPVCDPFFGRTTIPPPPTGSVTGRPADPCYQPPPLVQTPAQPPSGSCPPVVQMPAQPSAQSAPLTGTWSTNQPPAAARTTTQPASPPGLSPNYSAPRPSSTGSNSTLAPRPSSLAPASSTASPTAPSGDSRYAPPSSNFNYRGAATQGSTPSYTNVAATRPGSAADDRTPRPVDDSAADGRQADRGPITRTIQPRGVDDASHRPVDITDLPRTP